MRDLLTSTDSGTRAVRQKGVNVHRYAELQMVLADASRSLRGVFGKHWKYIIVKP